MRCGRSARHSSRRRSARDQPEPRHGRRNSRMARGFGTERCARFAEPNPRRSNVRAGRTSRTAIRPTAGPSACRPIGRGRRARRDCGIHALRLRQEYADHVWAIIGVDAAVADAGKHGRAHGDRNTDTHQPAVFGNGHSTTRLELELGQLGVAVHNPNDCRSLPAADLCAPVRRFRRDPATMRCIAAAIAPDWHKKSLVSPPPPSFETASEAQVTPPWRYLICFMAANIT